MNGIALLAFIVLFLSFFGVLAYNQVAGSVALSYAPPYYFVKDDWAGYANSFCFVLVFSLLFFGLGAPAAMAVEGLKYGVLFSTSVITMFDLAFIVPELFAMLAACTLGEGVMNDWSGKSTIYANWSGGMRYILIGIVVLAALVLVLHNPFISSW